MEIIYLTDIHDDLKSLRHLLQNTTADLYILSGDLIYKAFFTETKLYEFVTIQEDFYAYLIRHNIRGTPSELALSIERLPENYPPEYLSMARQYQKLFQQAASNMKDKYQILKDLVDRYAKAKTIFLPGNYDMDLQYTALYPYDLHNKSVVFNNLKLCGYGGAPIATSGIPEMVSVVFYEYNVDGRVISEPEDFFNNNLPDIALLHNPAYGTLDRLHTYGNVGSHGLRRYIDNHQPALVLSGHIHSDYGIKKIDKTLCLNPSNFGAVDSISDGTNGGYFSKINCSKNSDRLHINLISLYRINNKTISHILDVEIDQNLKLSQKVINQNEYNIIGDFIK